MRLGGPRWTGVGDGRWGVLSGRTLLDMRKGLLDAAQAVVGADDRLGVGVGQAPTCPFQPARVRARFPRVAVDTPGGAGKTHEQAGAEPLPGDLLERHRLGVVMGRADVLDVARPPPGRGVRDLHRPERRRDRADVRARTPAPVRKSAHATRTIPTRISPRPTKRPTMSQVKSHAVAGAAGGVEGVVLPGCGLQTGEPLRAGGLRVGQGQERGLVGGQLAVQVGERGEH